MAFRLKFKSLLRERERERERTLHSESAIVPYPNIDAAVDALVGNFIYVKTRKNCTMLPEKSP